MNSVVTIRKIANGYIVTAPVNGGPVMPHSIGQSETYCADLAAVNELVAQIFEPQPQEPQP